MSEAPSPQREERYDLRILRSLRKIIRAFDVHSRKLASEHGITGPQLMALLTIVEDAPLTATEISRRTHVSPSTMVGILDRLERKDLIQRRRDPRDRRRLNILATGQGKDLVRDAPSPLQDRLAQALNRLSDQERAALAFSLERIIEMMEAGRGEEGPAPPPPRAHDAPS